MKKFLVMLLICVNLALVVMLTFGAAPQKAHAQVRSRRGGGEYILVTGRRRSKDDVLYIIDSKARFLFGFWPDTSRGNLNLVPMGPRDLDRDFPVGGR